MGKWILVLIHFYLFFLSFPVPLNILNTILTYNERKSALIGKMLIFIFIMYMEMHCV